MTSSAPCPRRHRRASRLRVGFASLSPPYETAHELILSRVSFMRRVSDRVDPAMGSNYKNRACRRSRSAHSPRRFSFWCLTPSPTRDYTRDLRERNGGFELAVERQSTAGDLYLGATAVLRFTAAWWIADYTGAARCRTRLITI